MSALHGNPKESYRRRLIFMRGWLQGAMAQNPAWSTALEALEFAAGFHLGLRKNGQTPEFDHQLRIAEALLPHVPALNAVHERAVYVVSANPHDDAPRAVQIIAAAFLHDVREDYGVGHEVMVGRFGHRIANAVEALSKVTVDPRTGLELKKDASRYFEAIAKDPVASVVKGADRVHNLSTMLRTFSLEKQRRYVGETTEFFLPMLRVARREFPTQVGVYKALMDRMEVLVEAVQVRLEDHDTAANQAEPEGCEP